MNIKLFKRENSFKKKDFIFNTNFYWKTILLITFTLIFSSFVYSYILFMQTNQESTLSAENQGEQIPMFKKDRVQKALDYFNEKEKKSTDILNTPPPFVDPSL